MKSKSDKYVVPVLLILFNGFVVLGLLASVLRPIDRYLGRLSVAFIGQELYISRSLGEFLLFGPTAAFLLLALITEIRALCSPAFGAWRLQRNLRFAPLAIYVFAIVAMIGTDRVLIEYSKIKLRSHIEDSPEVTPPQFQLHSDYRDSCGNGWAERRSGLYLPVAIEGFNSADPQTRQRALLAAENLADPWRNGADREIINLMEKACRDQNAAVRDLSEKLMNDRWKSTCAQGFTKK